MLGRRYRRAHAGQLSIIVIQGDVQSSGTFDDQNPSRGREVALRSSSFGRGGDSRGGDARAQAVKSALREPAGYGFIAKPGGKFFGIDDAACFGNCFSTTSRGHAGGKRAAEECVQTFGEEA